MNLFKKQTRAQLLAIVEKAIFENDENAYNKATKKLNAMNRKRDIQAKIDTANSAGMFAAARRFKSQLEAMR